MFVHQEIKVQLSFNESNSIACSVEELVKKIGDQVHELDKVVWNKIGNLYIGCAKISLKPASRSQPNFT